jgi:hypothetical protein
MERVRRIVGEDNLYGSARHKKEPKNKKSTHKNQIG